MKKRGFTLVELLAIIVILGIVTLIATPVVLNLIQESKKGAFKASAMGLLDAAQYYISDNQDTIPSDGCKVIDIKELPIKNPDSLNGTIKVCSDGDASLEEVTDGEYYASGTKEDLAVTEDVKQLPGYKPLNPTITASDGKISGMWHDENYTLTISGEDNFEIYYGTTKESTTKGNEITTGKGIDEVGTQKYYAKVCNTSGSCSDVVEYVAKLETCLASASITGNTTSSSKYSSNDVKLTAVANNDCNSGVASYTWYKDGTVISGATSSTYTTTESGSYDVKITYNSGKYETESTKVYIDKTTPACEITASGTIGSNSWYTSNVTVKANITSSGASGATVVLKKAGTTVANPYTHSDNTTGVEYSAVVTSGSGKTATCTKTIKKDSATLSKPTITASDGKISGSWHTSSYKLSISGSSSTSGVTYYLDTNNPPTTENKELSSETGISTSGTATYYGKICNGAGTCSAVTSYIARLETCVASASITGNTTSSSNYTSGDVTLTAVANSSCNSGAASYQWYKDGSAISGATSSTYKATTTGTYGVVVTYVSGQVSSTYTTNVYIDAAAPTTTAPTLSSTTTSSIVVKNNQTDALSGLDTSSYQVRYRKSGTTSWTTKTSSSKSYTITGLEDDVNYEVQTYVKDKAGNGVWSSSATKDTLPLGGCTIAISPSGWATSKTATITCSGNGTYQYNVASGTAKNSSGTTITTGVWNTITGTTTVTFSTNGSITARVQDGTNTNSSSTYTINQVTVLAKPTCTILASGTAGITENSTSYYRSNVGLTMETSTAPESGLTFGFGTSNTPFYTTGSVTSGNKGTGTQNLTTQNSKLSYYGYVRSGITTDTGSCSKTIYIDTTVPSCSLSTTATVTNGWYKANVTYSITYADGQSGVYQKGTSTSYGNETSITTSSEGSAVTVTAYVKDKAGNTSTCQKTAAIDKTAPTTAVPSLSSTTSSIVVTNNQTDALSGIDTSSYQVRYRKSGATSWTTKTASSKSYTISGLEDAVNYEIQTYVKDKAGNGVWSSSVTKDTAALGGCTIAISPSGWATSKTATITCSGNGTYQYNVASGTAKNSSGTTITTGTWNTITGTTTLTFSTNGSITARVQDGTNTNSSSTYTVNQITTLAYPTCTITSSGTAGITENSTSYYRSNVGLTMETSTAPESGLTFGFGTSNTPFYTTGSVTSGNKGTGTQNLTTTNKSLTYNGYVRSGITTDTGSCSKTIYIDTTAPSCSISTTTSPNGYGWYKSNVAYNVDYYDANSGIYEKGATSGTISTEGSSQTASAKVTDKALNAATCTKSVNIDKTMPTITSVSTSSSTYGSITVTIGATDSLSGVAAYHVNYRESGGSWLSTDEYDSNVITLSGLKSGVTYEIEAVVKDKADNYAYATVKYQDTKSMYFPELNVYDASVEIDLTEVGTYYDSNLSYTIEFYDEYGSSYGATNASGYWLDDEATISGYYWGTSGGTRCEGELDMTALYNDFKDSNVYPYQLIADDLKNGVEILYCVYETANTSNKLCKTYIVAGIDEEYPSDTAPTITDIGIGTAVVQFNQTDNVNLSTSRKRVYYKLSSASSWSYKGYGSSTTATLTGLTGGETYDIKTYACDTSSNCKDSQIVQVTIPLIANCAVSNITYNGYTVTCDADTSVTNVSVKATGSSTYSHQATNTATGKWSAFIDVATHHSNASGTYTNQVYCNKSDGVSVGPYSAPSAKVDTTPPVITISEVTDYKNTSGVLMNDIDFNCSDDNGSLASVSSNSRYAYKICQGATCNTYTSSNSGFTYEVNLDTSNYVEAKCLNAAGNYSKAVKVYPQIPSGYMYRGYLLSDTTYYNSSYISQKYAISGVSYTSLAQANTLINQYKSSHSEISSISLVSFDQILDFVGGSYSNSIYQNGTTSALYTFNTTQAALINAKIQEGSTILSDTSNCTSSSYPCYGKVLRMNNSNVRWVSSPYMDTIYTNIIIDK